MKWRKAKGTSVYAFDENELAGDSDDQLLAQVTRSTHAPSAADSQAVAKAIEHLRKRGLKVPR